MDKICNLVWYAWVCTEPCRLWSHGDDTMTLALIICEETIREILYFQHFIIRPLIFFLSMYWSLLCLPHIAIWDAVSMLSLIHSNVFAGYHIWSRMHLFPVFSNAVLLFIQIVFIHIQISAQWKAVLIAAVQ